MNDADKGHAWIVAVSMGYGHLRAAFPLASFARGGEVVIANEYADIPNADKKIWDWQEKMYSRVSRLSQKGIMGRMIFNFFDSFQKINNEHPRREEKTPSAQLKAIRVQIERGWGSHLIRKLSQKPLPLVTTFFTVAHMAEHWKYPGRVYVVVTDADISRAWAPFDPEHSAIRYLAPTLRSMERLASYGVSPDHIFYTGFPLPPELIGPESRLAKQNLFRRLGRLDPLHHYKDRCHAVIESSLGGLYGNAYASKPPTVLFAIGGAGAQAEIGNQIIKSLADFILRKRITLRLAAGTFRPAAEEWKRALRESDLLRRLNDSVFIHSFPTKAAYFRIFNKLLASTDVLWTKPSELSFYGALGMPILMAPPLGSQEVQNRKWLLGLGAGIDAQNPRLTHEWLPHMIESGRLAECAMQGFVEMERNGTENIGKIISKNKN